MASPDPARVVQAIVEAIVLELERARSAAASAASAATDEESRAEDKHDTRSTEASYLARGHSERVAGLERELTYYRNLKSPGSGPEDPVQAGALVRWSRAGVEQWTLLSAHAGGWSVDADGISVRTMGTRAPLGQALLGARAGDSIEVEGPKGTWTCEILQVVS